MGPGTRTARAGILIALAMLLTVTSTSLMANAQDVMEAEGPGIEWTLPDTHMLYLKGTEEQPFLDRNWTTNTGQPLGRAEFTKTSSALNPNLIDIQSAPLAESFRFEGNITVRLFASLDSTNDGCRLTNVLPGSAGAETSFSVTLSLGSSMVIENAQTNSLPMEESYLSAHEFTVQALDVNVSLASGDSISLQVDVQHDCLQQGVLWWGTYDATSGIIFDGNVIEPKLEYSIDSNRMARVEFTPISPWGPGDFDGQVLEIVGPLDWDEMVHGFGKEDQRLEHFETPHGTRTGEGNRTILTWSSEKPLLPGRYMIDACFTVTDQNPGELCDAIGVLRFEIPQDPKPMLSSMWAAVVVPLGIIAWIGVSMREAMLPIQTYAILLLLAIAALGPAMHLPDIDSNAPREEGAAPSFALLSHDGELVKLPELLKGSDAVVVGLFRTGSPNAIRQFDDFRGTEIISESNIVFIQIATGEGVQSVDLDTYSLTLNESWPLLMDEADAAVGKAFPSGATDAVIIIDSAGFVTDWQPGTMSALEIDEAVSSASRGSGNNPLSLFSVIIGTALLPLAVLAMPRDRELELPEESLFPGAGALMTAAGAAAGFGLWALPVALMAAFGLGAFWIWVELLLAVVLVYHGMSVLLHGKIAEAERLITVTYSRLPDGFRAWRDRASFAEDVYLGLWLAWLLWLRTPVLIPQGVGAVARSDILGILLSVLAMLGFLVAAGIVVNIARLVALSPGNLSRVFGWLSVGIRPRAWGLASAILGTWVALALLVGPVMGSL
uniref:Redoxin domain-containing protein n=1 Tax=uncultured marine group II/III euryarchaeote KM3_14_E02 TaxID=1457890 RepID=A0A075GDR5_9EURY|nr:hypothetical protein [uncultured marine group II/III euryarchaeote KM3_14_E02]